MKHNAKPDLMYLKPKNEAMVAEYPAEKRFVSRVEYPKEGGILTWFHNERYPEKQLVYPDMFAVLNPVKRSVLVPIRLLKNSRLAQLFFVLMFILPGGAYLRKLLFILYTDTFHAGLQLVALKPDYYCTAMREVHRAGHTYISNNNLNFKREDIWKVGLKGHLPHETAVFFFCLFFEYDNAYRYRFQDIAGIFSKESFLKNPKQEVKRVINEYKKRELIDSVARNIGFLQNAILFLLTIPKIKRHIVGFIKELDVEKLRLDDCDRYWSYHRLDYNVEGMDLIDRMRRKSLMKL